MTPNRHRDYRLDIASVVVLIPLLAVPLLTRDPLIYSLTGQVAIGVVAAMGVYIMLRLGLLSFTVPAFMAIGGYAAAILATTTSSDLLLLMLVSFVVPAIVAVPLGALVLRLRGVYFIFITFVTNEILQIVLFELPGITGGSNGIPGVPPATIFGRNFDTTGALVFVTVLICLVAMAITLATTQRYRAEFTSIDENETLTESLGVAVWKYRLIGFVVSAGVSGLAGFALVNLLSTAHPSSFASWSVNNYLAYVFIGGRATMLGGVVGGGLLIVMTNFFSSYSYLAPGLFGLLLVIVLTVVPGGIVGTFVRIFTRQPKREVHNTEGTVDERA